MIGSLPHPDPNDALTVLHGLMKRVLVRPAVPDPALLAEFSGFVEMMIPKMLTPLSSDCDTSFYTWIEKKNYPRWRKEELTAAYESMHGATDSFDFTVGGFIKDECYPEYKHARGINARNDRAKTLFGPIFSLIEDEVFKLHFFIKKIPKNQRAQFLKDFIYDPTSCFAISDFTSFEAHFIKLIMQIIERPLYKYMTQKLDKHKIFMYFYDTYILGINKVKFKYYKVNIEATRMTGEMNTSLGNGWANLMLYLFTLYKSGIGIDELLRYPLGVEGDDGLARIRKGKFRNEIFTNLGFNVKLSIVPNIEEASFCGNVFDPDDMVIIPNIIEALLELGWGSATYSRSKITKKLGFLRAKAFSLIYEYSGCPLLQPLAHRIIFLTRNLTAMYRNTRDLYQTERNNTLKNFIRNNELPNKPISLRTRFMVEKLQGITVDSQIILEKFFSELTNLKEYLTHPLLDMYLTPLHIYNSNKYVMEPLNKRHFQDVPSEEVQFSFDKNYIQKVRNFYKL